jgi:microsomal dipeptidase-like Zn-dependent dipeptidase
MKKNVKYCILLSVSMLHLSCSAAHKLDSYVNSTVNPPGYAVSDETIAFHKSLTIVDLHSDSLLWERDLLQRNNTGHVDFPRLAEGNVAVQAFTIVSILPFMMNTGCNLACTDSYCCLSVLQGWPSETMFSFKERAAYQITKLHDAEMRSNGRFTIIMTKADLDNYLVRRKSDKNITAGFIGLEGTYPLGGKAENVNEMFDAGVRMIGMTHFADSDMAGSAHGFNKAGLTREGRELVKLLNKKGIIIDLAHASRETIKDILAVSSKPVLFSHTGLKGVCDNNRNITDEEIKGIALNGGVIGIAFFSKAVCGNDVSSIVNSIVYAVNLAGIDHVALGSDYDGAVSVPVDSARLIYITDALLKKGFTKGEVAKIMGENTIRVMREVFP